MKKKLFSLLLAVLMVATVFAPLTAFAADDPVLRVTYKSDLGTTTYIEYPLSAAETKLKNDYGGKLSFSRSGDSTLWVSLKDFAPVSGGEGYSIYVKAPKSSWDVIVSVTGTNTLGVQYVSALGAYAALSSNANIWVYAANNGASLSIGGLIGKNDKQEVIDRDYFGICGNSVDLNSYGVSAKNRLNLNVDFSLNMTGFTAKQVYPFKVTGKKQSVLMTWTTYFYNHVSNYTHTNPENSPIILDGSTYFNTTYYAGNKENEYAHAYHTVKYAETFTGVVNVATKYGMFCGGAYGGEGPVKGKISDIMERRHLAVIDGIQYYHAIARNCTLNPTRISGTELSNAFAFPLKYGYTLPGSVRSANFVAKVKWTVGDETEDVTGKKAEYAKKYKATVTLVPLGLTYLADANSLLDDYKTKAFNPGNTYAIGFSDNGTFDRDFYLRFNPLLKPALTITKQPVDYEGSGSNRKATFTVEASDDSVVYQWQTSENGTDNWTNLADSYTTSGGIRIAGAKSKTLIYDFNHFDPTTKLQYFRCVIVRGTEERVDSNVVKYTYTDNTKTVTSILISGFNSQPGANQSFYNSPAVLEDGKNVSWSGGGDNYKVLIVSSMWYEGEAGAGSPAAVTDGSFKEGKTYTYRIVLRPAKENVHFAASMDVAQEGTGRAPTAISKSTDGRWTVDFTFGPIGRVIDRIYLQNVVTPYNGVGYIRPVVPENITDYRLDPAFTRGWLKEGTAEKVPAPQVGERYSMEVFLYTADGNEFTAAGKKPGSIVLDLRDRDMNSISADKVEYTFIKKANGEPDFTKLLITLTFECKEVHVIKGGKIMDLDFPEDGKTLDTEVTLETPMLDFKQVEYLVNGEKVADPANTKVEEGDFILVSVVFGQVGDMLFDKDIYVVWYFTGDSAEEARKVYRDTSYGDPSLCAFSVGLQVQEGELHAVTVTNGTADAAAAKFGATVKLTADAAPEGKVFDKWVVVTGGVTLVDADKESASFTMGDQDVEIEATYKDAGPVTPTYMKGDVDGNGVVDAADARFALRAAVGLDDTAEGLDFSDPNNRCYLAADVDGEAGITASDARLILRAAVGLETLT